MVVYFTWKKEKAVSGLERIYFQYAMLRNSLLNTIHPSA